MRNTAPSSRWLQRRHLLAQPLLYGSRTPTFWAAMAAGTTSCRIRRTTGCSSAGRIA